MTTIPTPIFSFVFPFREGGEFRCMLNFADVDAASEWCTSLLTEGEFCDFAEVPSRTYVFDPVKDAHHAVSMEGDGWKVLEVVD